MSSSPTEPSGGPEHAPNLVGRRGASAPVHPGHPETPHRLGHWTILEIIHILQQLQSFGIRRFTRIRRFTQCVWFMGAMSVAKGGTTSGRPSSWRKRGGLRRRPPAAYLRAAALRDGSEDPSA